MTVFRNLALYFLLSFQVFQPLASASTQKIGPGDSAVSFNGDWDTSDDTLATTTDTGAVAQVILPDLTVSATFNGLKTPRGGLYGFCVDCDVTNGKFVSINGQDTSGKSSQLVALFTVKNLDPKVGHTLTIKNQQRNGNNGLIGFFSVNALVLDNTQVAAKKTPKSSTQSSSSSSSATGSSSQTQPTTTSDSSSITSSPTSSVSATADSKTTSGSSTSVTTSAVVTGTADIDNGLKGQKKFMSTAVPSPSQKADVGAGNPSSNRDNNGQPGTTGNNMSSAMGMGGGLSKSVTVFIVLLAISFIIALAITFLLVTRLRRRRAILLETRIPDMEQAKLPPEPQLMYQSPRTPPPVPTYAATRPPVPLPYVTTAVPAFGTAAQRSQGQEYGQPLMQPQPRAQLQQRSPSGRSQEMGDYDYHEPSWSGLGHDIVSDEEESAPSLSHYDPMFTDREPSIAASSTRWEMAETQPQVYRNSPQSWVDRRPRT